MTDKNAKAQEMRAEHTDKLYDTTVTDSGVEVCRFTREEIQRAVNRAVQQVADESVRRWRTSTYRGDE